LKRYFLGVEFCLRNGVKEIEVAGFHPEEYEEKWQRYWEERGIMAAPDVADRQRKTYILVMFAYPSGDIHMGHFRNYAVGDAVARFHKMCGRQVLFPFGWDAFGLPAEEAAIKRGLNPRDWTLNNIRISRQTLKRCGILFDWSREVTTCLPDYYRWTQWMFLLMYKRGLAYRGESSVNWCPGCKTVLANEQVHDGRCWRCKSEVTKRQLKQWFFRITDFADRLLKNLDSLDWPEPVKVMQRNWIGRSEGTIIKFRAETGEEIPVFTTRADTVFGVTFLVLAPEHPLTLKLAAGTEQEGAVAAYVEAALKKPEYLRTAEDRKKEGVFIGRYAINPLNNERVPLFVADYVLYHYGTGAVMGVPAHDQRDFEFAKERGLPIRVVVKPTDAPAPDAATMEAAFTDYGVMVNSGQFSGLPSQDGIKRLNSWLAERGLGGTKVTYRLRDWLISRQRYWGAPIPIIHCPKCGVVAVPEEQLPVLLPEGDIDFVPKGRSPLEDCEKFINTECPQCGAPAKRDPDTMDTFVCSSWYFLRYTDPHNDKVPFDKAKAASWMPVDIYIGGIEHATMHLIYFRFFNMVLYDAGYLPYEEPALRLFNHGMVLDEHGEVMSKSKGNVVSPRELIEAEGADVARIAMFFAAPSDAEIRWSERGITGARRFLNRLYNLITSRCSWLPTHTPVPFNWRDLPPHPLKLWRKLHQTIKRCRDELSRRYAFNTAIAAMMELLNTLEESPCLDDATEPTRSVVHRVLENFILLLAPFAPHTAEELHSLSGHKPSVFDAPFPDYDEEAAQEETLQVPVQINGKVRARITLAADADEETAKSAALQNPKIARYLEGKQVRKVVYVPRRILNFIVS